MKTLITGFHSDIAQALLDRRVKLGDDVFMTTSNMKPDEKSKAQVFAFDLAQPQNADVALKKLLADGIDALILNAAGRIPEPAPLHEQPFNSAQEYLRTNIEGNLWLIQQTLPSMIKKGFGRILFISSINAVAGTSNYGVYNTAKAALEGLIFNLSVDYGSYGIFSNVIRPGIIATSRTERYWSRPGYQKIASKLIPAGKLGTAEQVAEATDALLSPTSYINGAVLDVGGGLPRFKSKDVT